MTKCVHSFTNDVSRVNESFLSVVHHTETSTIAFVPQSAHECNPRCVHRDVPSDSR
jgi:hypothetical protein